MTRSRRTAGGRAVTSAVQGPLHRRVMAARVVAAIVSLTAATGTARLMWALPWELDVLVTVVVAAGWCLWLDRK